MLLFIQRKMEPLEHHSQISGRSIKEVPRFPSMDNRRAITHNQTSLLLFLIMTAATFFGQDWFYQIVKNNCFIESNRLLIGCIHRRQKKVFSMSENKTQVSRSHNTQHCQYRT